MPPVPGRSTLTAFAPLTVISASSAVVAWVMSRSACPEPLNWLKPAALSSSTLAEKVQSMVFSPKEQVPTSVSAPLSLTSRGTVIGCWRFLKRVPTLMAKESPALTVVLVASQR